MKGANGSLTFSVWFECPECGKDQELCNNEELTEEGWIYSVICADNPSEAWKDINVEFDCVHCEKTVILKDFDWMES